MITRKCGGWLEANIYFEEEGGTDSAPPTQTGSKTDYLRESRDWWHSLLAQLGKYSCYGVFLVLESDQEAVRLLTDFGQELLYISGKECLLLAISAQHVGKVEADQPDLWKAMALEHVKKGHSMAFARRFNVRLTDFPCLLLFSDVRKTDSYALIRLKGLTAEEMLSKLREVFTVVGDAVQLGEDPIMRMSDNLAGGKRASVVKKAWKGITPYGKKALETLIESAVRGATAHI